jgi:hypothetical protein
MSAFWVLIKRQRTDRSTGQQFELLIDIIVATIKTLNGNNGVEKMFKAARLAKRAHSCQSFVYKSGNLHEATGISGW